MKAAVGIIANPASGKDIRRLVAHAATVPDHAKASLVAQALLGLGAVGVEQVLIMPDEQQLGLKALRRLGPEEQRRLPQVEMLAMPITGRAADSTRAAAEMRARGVGGILVLGGDGTARAVSRGAGEVPLLCVSTGTNNVLPVFVEGTIAGMAVGAVALGLVPQQEVSYRSKQLVATLNGDWLDSALVDMALLKSRFTGTGAIWSPDTIRYVWVTRAEPHNIGLTSLAATQGVIGPREPFGRWLAFAGPSTTGPLAALAPGLVVPMTATAAEILRPDHPMQVTVDEPGVLTLDGEREHALSTGAHLEVTLSLDGPWLIDPQAAMRAWADAEGQSSSDRGVG